MTPIFMLFAAVFSIGMILLIKELSKLQARVWCLERKLDMAQVSIATCGAPAPHTHTAVVSFPNPTRKTQ